MLNGSLATTEWCVLSLRRLETAFRCGGQTRTAEVSDSKEGQFSRYSDSLRAGRSGDRIPVGARFSAPVQTGLGAHPASNTIGTGSFPGAKRPGHGVDHPPHLASRLKKEQSYTSAPSLGLRGWLQGELYFTLLYGSRMLIDCYTGPWNMVTDVSRRWENS